MIPLKLVLLGGTGFVGRALANRLCADGHAVVVLSRNLARHPVRLLPPGAELRECNVHDPAMLRAAFAGADAVVNLVGILNEAVFYGCGFHRTVIAACEQAGVRRLLQMSALNAGCGQSHYLASRGEAEALVKASTLAWTIFQSSVIFPSALTTTMLCSQRQSTPGLLSPWSFSIGFSQLPPPACRSGRRMIWARSAEGGR